MRVPIRRPGKYTNAKADTHFTEAKLAELNEKLAALRKAQPIAADEMRRLAEMGDLSENAAYQIAKGRLRGINDSITKLENLINQAIVISPHIQSDTVILGSTVTVDVNGKRSTYQILGSSEADPSRGIISHQSPLGSAIMGKRIGDSFTVETGTASAPGKIISIK